MHNKYKQYQFCLRNIIKNSMPPAEQSKNIKLIIYVKTYQSRQFLKEDKHDLWILMHMYFWLNQIHLKLHQIYYQSLMKTVDSPTPLFGAEFHKSPCYPKWTLINFNMQHRKRKCNTHLTLQRKHIKIAFIITLRNSVWKKSHRHKKNLNKVYEKPSS